SLLNRCREEAEFGISNLGRAIASGCSELLAEWIKDIEAKVLNHKLGQGVVKAQGFASICAEELNRVVAEAVRDMERCRQDVMFQYDEINSSLGKMAGVGIVGKLFGGKAKQSALLDVYHTWLNCRLEKEVSANLVETLHKLVTCIDEIRRELTGEQAELSRIVQHCRLNWQKISFQANRNSDSTVLVQEALTKEECDAWLQKHYPADLQEVSHRVWLELNGSLGDRMLQICEGYFAPLIAETTLIKFLREKFKSKEEWNQWLDELREVCRPFWTARLRHGELYNQTCLIGLAVNGNDYPTEVESWARDRSDATRGIDIVNTHFSYAMDITVCTHGAFAGYLSGVPDYYFHYEQFLRNREFPLHLHERFINLPELDPLRDKEGRPAHG
ncbi:MAG TPA: hypothetical protein VNU93_06030, partial [Verrucomicrobiae bacterium]|nr:hypothetical protein [Verrucomicrobiae bacterium]